MSEIKTKYTKPKPVEIKTKSVVPLATSFPGQTIKFKSNDNNSLQAQQEKAALKGRSITGKPLPGNK